MAVAKLTCESNKFSEFDLKSDIFELKYYLKSLKGRKIMTIEASDTSQWLYTELRSFVDTLVVCDPARNHLLKEGPKTDKIDARKLAILLRAGMLKPVFHTGEDLIYIRRIVSAHEDVVKEYVRLENQRKALYRSIGKNAKNDKLNSSHDKFIHDNIELRLESVTKSRENYIKEFKRLSKVHKQINLVRSVPGIDYIGAVRVIARVIDIKRFKNKHNFWSYCGLVKIERVSGGKLYGRKNPRYCRTMKNVFKIAAFATINAKDNEFKDYYNYLLEEKNKAKHEARHAIARKIATIVYGVLKNNEKYKTYKRRLLEKIK
jgi:transposase